MDVRKTVFRFAKKMVFWRNMFSYKLHGCRPWNRGYFEYKWSRIVQALYDKKTIDVFRTGDILPEHFGQRIDERIVEYPWVVAHMSKGSATLLDAGSALNFETILFYPSLKEKKITIVTLNPESNCFWNRGVSYLFDDLRNLPFKSESFDIITCISTLEHIGMDNTKVYTTDSIYKENRSEDYLVALKELRRVLKTGGVLLLTVPFGTYNDFGWFQQFNQDMVSKMMSVFGADNGTAAFYAYTNGGWQISNAEECSSAEYITADRAKVSLSLPAAASAVACLKLTK